MSRQTYPPSPSAPAAARVGADRRHQLENLTYAILVVFLTYYLVIGGSALGNSSAAQIAGGAAGGLLILRYLSTKNTRHNVGDALELWLVVALTLFAIAGVLAVYRRQALDVILTTLAYLAALDMARQVLAAPRARTVLMTLLQASCLVLEVVIVLTWGGVALRFLRSTGFTVWPAANLALPTWAWGQRHDLALLVILLLPAFFTSSGWYKGRAFAVVAVAMAAVILMLDGSRNLWFAVVGAGGVVALVRTRRGLRERIRPWHAGALVIAVAGVGLTAVASGLAVPLASRLSNVTTVLARSDLWSASVTAWLQHPVAGWGAGSFPFLLQETPYFQSAAWAPLHPDSALFQLLAETGIVGLAAAACALTGVALALRTAKPVRWSAVWAVLVFALTCLAANPTDFGFLVAVAICWLAYAAPHQRLPQTSDGVHTWSIPRPRYGLAILVMVAFWASSTIATLSWDQARAEVAQADLQGAQRAARTAAMLDPGEAIYHRGLGAILVVQGELAAAVAELRQAAALNPGDPIAYRALAVAEDRAGNVSGALQASRKAAQLQPTVSANQLLYARLLAAAGQLGMAQTVLADAARISPTMLALPTWSDPYGAFATTSTTLEVAANQWATGSPVISDFAGIWLAVLANRPDLLDRLLAIRPDLAYLGNALLRLANCDPVGAQAELGAGPTSKYYDARFWTVEAMLDVATGQDPRQAYGAIEALTGHTVRTTDFTYEVGLLVDQSTFGLRDIWGYHRLPLGVDLPGFQTPLASTTTDLWLTDPQKAARAIGPSVALSMCPH